jgi:hypothetical protein
LLVAHLVFTICSLNVSGCMEPAPNKPNPPALLTAEANLHPEHQTIPPWMIGYLTENNWQIRFTVL